MPELIGMNLQAVNYFEIDSRLFGNMDLSEISNQLGEDQQDGP